MSMPRKTARTAGQARRDPDNADTAPVSLDIPPLRQYEEPDSPAAPLDIPPERDTFSVPGEEMTTGERRFMAVPVLLPPLHPTECPDSVARVFTAEPDPRLDGPEWGTAKKAPDIRAGKERFLMPWDD